MKGTKLGVFPSSFASSTTKMGRRRKTTISAKRVNYSRKNRRLTTQTHLSLHCFEDFPLSPPTTETISVIDRTEEDPAPSENF